jgi:hypothetical protein
MGRTPHLQETLLKNIRDNLPKEGEGLQVEFVLVNYNSKDGLKEWIEDSKDSEELQRYIKDGILVYRQYPDAKAFHHAHAKNMAHRIATGDVVCNLDADNFTGKGFARALADKFADGTHAFVHPSSSALEDFPSEERGAFGRIALLREDFIALGGYSETRFKGWGYEDTDFIIRAFAYGLKPRPIFEHDFLKAIAHDNEERVKNTDGGITVQGIEKLISGRTTFKQLRFTFREYVSSVQTNRNHGLGKFGMGTVLRLDGTEQVIGAVEPFARISRRNIHALLPKHRDNTMKPPAQTVGA